ncbi:MAG: 30S ribosomal protein S4 [Thermoanaerobaculia bacterium]|nr:30S ribosomal protein S4 [Thermoanaerobaculia bacterium]
MAKYTGPKVKLSRRLGIALTPKAQKYMERKPYPPGQHGPNKRRRRPSNYGRQLLEKQRLKAQFNVGERYLRRIFREASRRKGSTGEVLVSLLERRIDALVLRAGLARTIYQARQAVSHGHILLNGKRCDRPSAWLRPGDRLAVRSKSRRIPCFNQPRTATVPDYLRLVEDGYGAELSAIPQRGEIPVICDERLVVEFYSR